ncbi:MAG TPA: SMP-30/gluconolactonase/LRE family protein [Vicinamibacterales bacterium]|nr:SMP-30/gluconolactonase/LRE family protein [Vicinamibacterales bacterium]
MTADRFATCREVPGLLIAIACIVIAASLVQAQPKRGAAAAQKDEARTPVQAVWPLPPEQPRVQFVAAYASSVDVEGPARKSRVFALKEALLGKERMAAQLPRVKRFQKPYGVAVDPQGRIVVTDTLQGTVFVVDAARRAFTFIGAAERQFALSAPAGVAADAHGNIYVGDSGNSTILQFGPDLRFVRIIGRQGDVRSPSGIALDPSGKRLYAVDTQGHAVASFDVATGRLIRRTGERGTKPGQFGFPSGIAVAPDGLVYVADTMNYRVQVFDPDLTFQRSFGSVGDTPGRFRRPKGIAVDAEHVVYVVDSDFNNFQMFSRRGEPLLAVGEYGVRPGQMMLPAGICVDRARRRIVVAEQMNKRVQVFERVGPPA